MALYHCSVKTISRSKGQNAIAAGAYRSGEKLINEQTAEIFDYRRKSGVLYKEIILPTGISQISRNQLWNLAESSEGRKNSTVAREYELALPHELDESARLGLAREFAEHLTSAYGVGVDLAVHAPGRYGDSRNHHAHILTTTRVMTSSGLGAKTRTLDDRKTGEIEKIRERWAAMVNGALTRAGQEARVSHKSLKDQGSARHPTVHLGPSAAAMERRGEPSDRGGLNRAVEEHNFHLSQADELERQLRSLQHELGARLEEAPEAEPQGGLAGLVKRGWQKISELWPGHGGARPEPAAAASPPDASENSQPVKSRPEARRPSPLRQAVDLLNKAEQAAARLKAWAESVQAAQDGWATQLKEVEALALDGDEASAQAALGRVKSEVQERLSVVEITKLQDLAVRQAEKAREIGGDLDEHVEERAEQIDKTARQSRYRLLVVRDIWAGKIKSADDFCLKEQKISLWSRKLVQAAGVIYGEARTALDRLAQVGQDLESFSRKGEAESTKAARALLTVIDDDLSPTLKQVHERSREIWRPIRKLKTLAAERAHLNDAARQASDLAGQAVAAVKQALESLQDLVEKCLPLRELARQAGERQEPKPEIRQPRPRGQGR